MLANDRAGCRPHGHTTFIRTLEIGAGFDQPAEAKTANVIGRRTGFMSAALWQRESGHLDQFDTADCLVAQRVFLDM